jgi:hypothetical protein
MALHKAVFAELAVTIVRNPGSDYAAGLVALVAGLALVIGHTAGRLPCDREHDQRRRLFHSQPDRDYFRL